MSFFTIMANLRLDGRGFHAGIREADRAVGRFASGLKAQLASVFTAAFITNAVKNVISFGSEISDMSKKLNISKREVQEWNFAMKQAGLDIGSITAAFKALSVARDEVLVGKSDEKASIFEALGISKDQLRGNAINTTMRQVAEAFRTMNFGAAEGDMISSILGKSGLEMLSVFKDGIEEQIALFNQMGGAIEDNVVDQLDAAGDAMDRLTIKLKNEFAPIVTGTANVFVKIHDAIDGVIKRGVFFTKAFVDVTRRGGDPMEVYSDFEKLMGADARIAERHAMDAAGMRAMAEHKKGAGRIPKEWLPPPKEEKAHRTKKIEQATDALARIGGFIGGTGSTANRLVAIEKELQKVNRHLADGLFLRD